MIYLTPNVPVAPSIGAAAKRFAPGTLITSPQASSRDPNVLLAQPRPLTTEFDDDLPGCLSQYGPRHDNDHVFIKDIQILPTTDEILSIEQPYMPRKNLNTPHFLPNGPERHFDTLFRHLRFDSTESLRDVCYHAAQTLASARSNRSPTLEPQRETPGGTRYYGYQDAKLEEVNGDEKKGLIMRFSYDCPEFMRGRFIHNCGRLLEGMLCALICLDEASLELSVVFLEIYQRQSTTSMDNLGGVGKRAAIELSFPASAPYHDILTISRQAQGLSTPRLALIEFPKALYAGFYWSLRRLQEMRPCDVSFLKYIAPNLNGQALSNSVAATHSGTRNQVSCDPPLYTQAPGFAFELDPIASKPTSYSLSQIQDDPEAFTNFLKKNTELDEGQAVAFHQNLTRELSFTQGPPGTGKTYLGIALSRALLASRSDRPSKPLLVVCQTNHALDSFLAGLRDAGIEKLIRIGSNSKEEWTRAINLREQKPKTRISDRETQTRNSTRRYKQGLFADLESWCKGLNAERSTKNVSWHAVEKILRQDYPDIHQQFVTTANNRRVEGFTFDYWVRGGDLQNLKDLKMELSLRLLTKSPGGSPHIGSSTDVEKILSELALETKRKCEAAGEDSIWRMPESKRQTLLRSWEDSINREDLAEVLAVMHLSYADANNLWRTSLDSKDAAILEEADVIGITTTASATRWNLLKMLQLETLICEEAGEVLEAHSLCSLLPTLDHAIFIGDPLQLRPEVTEQAMTLETRIGHNYRLNESLFERIMLPVDPSASVMPTSQLNVQRRMHPQIAAITRLTYPLLSDDPSTALHASVSGIEKRMFWLDHQSPELDPTGDSKSHVNPHEVAIVAGLVRYLLTRNTYSMGDIVVLTPYNGQLVALVEALKTSCQVWLNPKDREALLDDGVLPLEAEISDGQKDAIDMANLLRLATVDNFQGEEAKIIILSTVRSGGRPGFLKTANRVNVACSRARDGFYVVGNSLTLQQVPFWCDIVNIFAREGNIGAALRLCCDRHPHHGINVSQAADFDNVQDCQIPCAETLGCLHSCFQPCHDPASHDRIPCRKPCNRILGCGHKCQKMCFEKCGSCQYRIGEQTLSNCGHQVDKICGGSTPKCLKVVQKATLACGHIVDVRCFESEKEEEVACQQLCGVEISCGHICVGDCKECFPAAMHPPCPELCPREKECGHRCLTLCHGVAPCPTGCNQPCMLACEHGPCRSLCKRVCDPCVKTYIGQVDLAASKGPIICSLGHVIQQPDTFEGVFDRLLAKMGRNLDLFGYGVFKRERILQSTIDGFMKSIRPNPMAQESNKRELTGRGSELREEIEHLIDFRERIVLPFEQSIATCSQLLPGLVEYNLLFRARFDILEYRARAAFLRDTLIVVQQLMLLDDPSQGVQRQAESLQEHAVLDCLNCIQYCKQSAARCTASSPCVRVELLLQQVQFSYLAQVASLSTVVASEAVPALLDEALVLCRRYPNTAGAFLENFKQLRSYTGSDDPGAVPLVVSEKSRGTEKAWGQHIVGHLRICGNKHPYSTESFSGCPECGKKVETDEEMTKKASAYLHDDEFVKAMNKKK
jgi:hypothetical protein